ncbi:MAG: hypothetical protein HFE73_10160 [Firmicutes bacterium]|nr:hypothetical protein [Bacillota bacterium]
MKIKKISKDKKMKGNLHKKVMAAFMILLLALCSFGCGKDDSEPNTEDGDTPIQLEPIEDGPEGDGFITLNPDGKSANYDEAVNDETKDIKESDYSADEEQTEFDFGFSVSSKFTLSDMVKKVDYTDLSSLVTDMETGLSAAASSAFGGNFSGFSDYDEDDEDEIDKLAYAIVIEDDDTEGRTLERGVYHHIIEQHFQYIALSSRNYYEVNDSNLDAIIKDAKKAMGITISKSRLKKGLEIALKNANEKKDYYSLCDVRIINGNGFTETIKVTADCFCSEEDEVGYYVYVERERCYN